MPAHIHRYEELASMVIVSAIEPGQPSLPGTALVGGTEDSLGVFLAHQGDRLLVCADDDHSRPSRLVRAVLDQPDIALVRLRGTATQQALVLRFLHTLPVESYGRAQNIADIVLASCHTVMALTSVSGLDGVRASIWQHARSMFPGASFQADLRTGVVQDARPCTMQIPAGAFACFARSTALTNLKLQWLGRQAEVRLPDSPNRLAGARQWAELSWIENPGDLVPRALAGLVSHTCPGCGRTIVSDCPFCGCLGRGTYGHSQSPLERKAR